MIKNIKEEIKLLIKERTRELWGGPASPPASPNRGESLGGQIELPDFEVERPANDFGDYAVNIAFVLSKKLQMPPQKIAEILAVELNKYKPGDISRIEVVGGYINFFLDQSFLQSQLIQIHKQGLKFGKSNIGKKHKVIVEYSSVNIAKPMHAGHLRTTLLGDAIANILEFSGYKVIRWNYLGDWGTQFGKVIAAYKKWSGKEKVKANPIKELVSLYVMFNQEEKEHPELQQEGQDEFRKLEAGDKENRKLWKWFVDETKENLKNIYGLLDIKFDSYVGESFYENKLKPLIDKLIIKGIAKEGEGGALIINLDAFDLPPALIRKSDGATLYMTRDIANLEYRLEKYKPAKILFVVSSEQNLHFRQLFEVAEILRLKSAELRHINYGLVLGEDNKKLSTRGGNAITADDMIFESIERADKIVREKNTDMSEKQYKDIARIVGVGALKYAMLKDNTRSDIVFSWQKILDFKGDSGPYLQYTYARLHGILRKASSGGSADPSLLTEKSELAIIKHLIDFPDTIEDSARKNITNNLALYLYELTSLTNHFYETASIIKDENIPRRNARLILIETVANVLKIGLNLLGMGVLNKI